VIGFFTLKYLHGERVVDESSTVFIKKTENGFQLFRNGNSFYILGAGGNSYLKELADIGGNTIRVYDTINVGNILDDAQKNNLAVIVDIPLPKYTSSYNSYLDSSYNKVLKQRVTVLVKKYSNHPALLMWNLGNELHYPIFLVKSKILNYINDSLYFQEANFIKSFNELIDIIHVNDRNHPVCTTLIASGNNKEIETIYLNSPKLDLVSINLFGRLKDYNFNNLKLKFLFGSRPYYISEWGSDGHWESETTSWKAPIEPTSEKKAEQIRTRYNIINARKDNTCLGNLIFFWGYKQEITHTWFSIFDDHGNKSQSYYELQNLWKNSSENKKLAPKIRYMLINNLGARDQLIYKPHEIKQAEVFLDGEIDSTLNYKWEIYEENWNYKGANDKQKKAKIISDCFEKVNGHQAIFKTPEIEGPYRIFAYVYDHQGNFATTNTPFYVLNTK
jgi:hypothetical protein